jgi:hypothetical protein
VYKRQLDSSLVLPENFDMILLGIGSDIGGKIPLGYDANGERRYKYFSGKEIVVRYEEEGIKKMADSYDVPYIRVDDISDIASLSSGKVNPLSEREKMIVLFLASFCIFFGYFLHPYVQKK